MTERTKGMDIPERLKREKERGKELVEKDGKVYAVIYDVGQYRMLVADENALVQSMERKGTHKVG